MSYIHHCCYYFAEKKTLCHCSARVKFARSYLNLTIIVGVPTVPAFRYGVVFRKREPNEHILDFNRSNYKLVTAFYNSSLVTAIHNLLFCETR